MRQQATTLILVGFAFLWLAFQGISALTGYYGSLGTDRFPAEIIDINLDERRVVLSDSRFGRLHWGRDLEIPLEEGLKGQTILFVAEKGKFGEPVLRSAEYPSQTVADRGAKQRL